MPARFIQVAEQDRRPIEIDGVRHMALKGDTLLGAVPTYAGRLRQSESGDGSGAGRAYVDPGNTLNQVPQPRRPRPIMGSSEKGPGLFCAFGFCGAGFQVGPTVGDVMAEFIDKGHTSLSLDAYRIERFAQQKAA
jgi:hypothetical protein